MEEVAEWGSGKVHGGALWGRGALGLGKVYLNEPRRVRWDRTARGSSRRLIDPGAGGDRRGEMS